MDPQLIAKHESPLQTLAIRIVSDPQFRQNFIADPAAAIDSSGLNFDKSVKDVIVQNAKQAAGLTANMDAVTAKFFFWYSK